VPAADGFGDPQISWVIAAEGRRILHAGDTVFHGWWWLTKVRHGSIDTVFLPVNGPICNLPHRQPHSTLPAAMGPTQAAAAAAILEARIAVPIHYDTLNNPPIYTQVDNPAGAFEHSSRQLGVDTRVIAPGDWLELDD
jgi:L-ascorbate metabolism protein UlaG (beta-lactamase superfamily)